MDTLKKIIAPLAVGIIVGAIAMNFVIGSKISPQPQGAVSSPDISGHYFSYGGVRHWGWRTSSLTQASTGIVCAIQGPTATSTLKNTSSIRFTVGTTTETTISFYKATTSAPTLSLATLLATSTLAANAQGTFLAATTTPVSDTTNGRATITNMVFAPSEYMLVNMSGGTGTFSPTGVCEATFVEN